jgi:hypothetical protein
MELAGPRDDRLADLLVTTVVGCAWALWGAAGLAPHAGLLVSIAVLVVTALLLAGRLVLRRGQPTSVEGAEAVPGSMFRSRAYLLVVAGEVVAIAGGMAVLTRFELSGYLIEWIAAVVGVHFVLFGRLFSSMFHRLAAIFLGAAAVGVPTALLFGTRAGQATCGLLVGALVLGGAVGGGNRVRVTR